MHNKNGCYSGLALFLAFLGGTVAGALTGILLTTKSGQEVRWDVEDFAREKRRAFLAKAKNVRAALDDAIERGRTFISKQWPRAKGEVDDENLDASRWRSV